MIQNYVKDFDVVYSGGLSSRSLNNVHVIKILVEDNTLKIGLVAQALPWTMDKTVGEKIVELGRHLSR